LCCEQMIQQWQLSSHGPCTPFISTFSLHLCCEQMIQQWQLSSHGPCTPPFISTFSLHLCCEQMIQQWQLSSHGPCSPPFISTFSLHLCCEQMIQQWQLFPLGPCTLLFISTFSLHLCCEQMIQQWQLSRRFPWPLYSSILFRTPTFSSTLVCFNTHWPFILVSGLQEQLFNCGRQIVVSAIKKKNQPRKSIYGRLNDQFPCNEFVMAVYVQHESREGHWILSLDCYSTLALHHTYWVHCVQNLQNPTPLDENPFGLEVSSEVRQSCIWLQASFLFASVSRSASDISVYMRQDMSMPKQENDKRWHKIIIIMWYDCDVVQVNYRSLDVSLQ
jgi:hypothetical protein